MSESKIGPCDLCHHQDLPVDTYHAGALNENRTMDLCGLCSQSLASNVVSHPTLYEREYMICHTIMYVGNAILKEIRKLREDLARQTR